MRNRYPGAASQPAFKDSGDRNRFGFVGKPQPADIMPTGRERSDAARWPKAESQALRLSVCTCASASDMMLSCARPSDAHRPARFLSVYVCTHPGPSSVVPMPCVSTVRRSPLHFDPHSCPRPSSSELLTSPVVLCSLPACVQRARKCLRNGLIFPESQSTEPANQVTHSAGTSPDSAAGPLVCAPLV